MMTIFGCLKPLAVRRSTSASFEYFKTCHQRHNRIWSLTAIIEIKSTFDSLRWCLIAGIIASSFVTPLRLKASSRAATDKFRSIMKFSQTWPLYQWRNSTDKRGNRRNVELYTWRGDSCTINHERTWHQNQVVGIYLYSYIYTSIHRLHISTSCVRKIHRWGIPSKRQE